jgi:hypothetical protein
MTTVYDTLPDAADLLDLFPVGTLVRCFGTNHREFYGYVVKPIDDSGLIEVRFFVPSRGKWTTESWSPLALAPLSREDVCEMMTVNGVTA